jgi:PAS domain S-box-containing protein
MAPGVWRAQVHPDDLDRFVEADRISDRTGQDFDIEYRLFAKDGREVWLHEHAELIRGQDGTPRFWLGVDADITERKLAEQRLGRAEGRYRRLVEHLPAVVYIDAADEHSTALYVSPRYEDLLGYTPEDRTSQPDLWVRMLHPDDREWVLAESARTNHSGEPFICEYRLIAKDGRTVWVRDEAYLVQTDDAEDPVWQGVLLDITERKQTEESLRKRDAVLPAVGLAAQRFLKDPDWSSSIDEVFDRLGRAADVSRVYLFENAIAADGDLVASQRFEWTAPATPRTMGGPNTANWSYARTGCRRWVDVMSRGEALLGSFDDLPAAEQRLLDGEGIRALAIVPVIVGGDWWGFLGFDECRTERTWSPLEIEALRAAADILGTAIHRQIAERRLAETEAQFRTLIEQLPAVTYIDTVDDPWRTTYVSPQLESMVGYTPEEWKREPSAWYEALHPDDRDGIVAAVDQHNADGTPYEAEYRLVAKDGRVVWVRDQARIVSDPHGGETLWQGVMFDITSRVEAEHHLREAEERFRLMVEQSPAMLYIETPDPTAPSVYVSPKVEEVFGVTPDEYIADPLMWERLVHPDDRAQARSAYEGALSAGRSWLIEYRVVRPDGRVIWVRDESSLTRNERGEVAHVQGVVHDITERKLAEQTLVDSERRERQAADRLRALDEMKNTFLAAVSHELRSPLTSILGTALTLERQDRIADDDREDLLARLAANARKLDRLLKDLLDIDRLSRGIVTPQYRLTDVAALVRRTVEALDAVKGRQVYVQTETVLIPVDPAKVERIVENLVANAARHTASDARIWVRVAPKDGGALVMVEDDGPGIPEDVRTTIFEPFRQGPNVSKANPGTGIGLSLVARFAELHGGRAWAEDREGGGASFGVFLPGSRESLDHDGDAEAGPGAA